jgi:hypothetical protein
MVDDLPDVDAPVARGVEFVEAPAQRLVAEPLATPLTVPLAATLAALPLLARTDEVAELTKVQEPVLHGARAHL